VLRPVYIALLELKRYLTDWGDLAFSLALPIALFVLMYLNFGGSADFIGTAHVVDEDNGPYAHEFITRLDNAEGVKVKELTRQEADLKLNRSSILMAIYIPEGFSTRLASGETAEVVVKQRGAGGDEDQIVASIARGVAEELVNEARVRQQVRQAASGSSLPQAEIERTIDAYITRAREHPVVSVKVDTLGREPDFLILFLPGLIVMFTLFSVTLNSQTLVEERQNGTLERLLTTRLGVWQLFLGKFLAGWLRGVAQIVILLSLSFIVFRMASAITFFEMLLFSMLVAAAVSACGLLIGSLARTRDQASWFAVVFTMFMSVFGGTFYGFFDPGGILETLSKITLNHYAIRSLSEMLSESGGLLQQGIEALVMVGVCVVALVAARYLFKAVQGRR
jgi:ABC-2 type transport system permease protein